MKLSFAENDNEEMRLFHVECDSIEEADQFLSWLERKNESEVEVVINTAAEEPEEKPAEITRNDVSQAAIALVQTKGRQVLDPILAKYKAKRISEIPDEKLAEAFAAIKEVV